MSPNFLVEETTVRESGESAVLSIDQFPYSDVMLTLEVSHVKQQQDLDVDIFGSRDGLGWPLRPIASFRQKSCCGTYTCVVPHDGAHFLKAVWRVSRWGRNEGLPLFRFCLKAETPGVRYMAGAA